MQPRRSRSFDKCWTTVGRTESGRVLVIPPYHADLLELFDKAGLWGRFEAWKIGLMKLVYGSSDSQEVTGQLWDLSGYDRYSTEPVPEKGDRHTAVNWFWEPGHFKCALGDLLLKRVLDNELSDLGVELTLTTIGQDDTRSAATFHRSHRSPFAGERKLDPMDALFRHDHYADMVLTGRWSAMANSHSSGSPLPGIFLGKWGAEVSHLPALTRVMTELVIECSER